MALGIPLRYRGALERIAHLADADLEALGDALEGLSAFPAVSEIAAKVRSVIADDEETDYDRIAEALLNLALQRRRWGAEHLATLVASAPALDVPTDRREEFERFIRRVVEIDSVVSGARGLDVMFDREHLVIDARILTDIRPVFSDEPEPHLQGAAVINTLSLNYYTTAGVQKLQLAVDHEDLTQLRAGIDRALKKTATLRGLLEEAGTPYFDYAEEDDT